MTFRNILSGIAQNVVNSAFNAAATAVVVEFNAVQEINGRGSVDEVAKYPIVHRDGHLVLHGPLQPPLGIVFSKPPIYNIILHVPNAQQMYSLFRTDQKEEAEACFVLFKESIPLLVKIDPNICELVKLNVLVGKLNNNKGWSAPHVAAALGLNNCLRHSRMIEKLNEQEGVLLRTPLLVAVACENLGSVATLLELGVQVDLKDIKDNTIFHLAAEANSPQIMKLLLDKIPMGMWDMLNHLNAEGCTPLHTACKSNKAELVKMLLQAGASSNVRSATEGYAIHTAVKAKSISSIQELVRRAPEQLNLKEMAHGGSPLHVATGYETLIPLLELGSDPNTCDDVGNTALHNAVRRGCLKSTLNLLYHGSSANKKGENGDTPLHISARLCSEDVMKALITFGAEVDSVNNSGESARHLVSTSSKCSDSSIFILHAVGALRCDSSKGSCKDGCKHSGSFDGKAPENFPDLSKFNMLHDALHSLSLSVQQGNHKRGSEPMDVDGNRDSGGGESTNKSSNGGTTTGDLNSSVGGRLLCLDGGGIRGVVLTQILMVMEKEFGMRIIDMFDWIAGTSTGGILALSLACGKSAVEAQGVYMRLKDKVFVGERPYSAAVLEEFLKEEYGCEQKMHNILKPRIMVMTALVDRRPADLHIFRNYISPCSLLGEPEPYSKDPEDQFIWETAKITGAAPSYFRLDHDKLVDGGLISNNPTLDALTEMQHFATVMASQGHGITGRPTAVVTLGTGQQPCSSTHASVLDITWPSGIMDAFTKVPRLAHLVNLLVEQATQTEGQVVERSRAWCSSLGVPFYRFSPTLSAPIELDEKDDTKLINLLWETRCYVYANRDSIKEIKRVLFSLG